MRPLPTCLTVVCLLHGALLAALLRPATGQQPVTDTEPVPVQVSLLAPAAVPSPKPEPLPQQVPEPPSPEPASAKPSPRPAPAPLAANEPAAKPATEPLASFQTAAPASPSTPAVTTASPPSDIVSAAISEPQFDADYLQNPAPVYPALSRKRRETGVVLLRAHVLPDGSADQIELFESSGHSRLDDAAVRAVKHWRFVPAKRGDEAIAAWVRVPVRFDLRS